MELMMCGGLFTITYENSAESIPPLLFGQSKGTSQNCTKLCPIKTRPTLSIKHKLSPVITQLRRRRLRFLTHAIFFSLNARVGGEREHDPVYQMCHNRAHWCFHLSIPLFFSLTSRHLLASTAFFPGAGRCAHQSQRRVSGERALVAPSTKFGNKCHSGAKQLLSLRQAKPILSFWIMIMQNSVTRITGDESLSFLSSHPTRGDSPLM